MCFIIAGLQPKTKLLEQTPRRCPACGLHEAYVQRVDHYLSVFFIPLLPVKRGEPFLFCQRCNQPVDESMRQPGNDRPFGDRTTPARCPQCGRTVQVNFRYCPHCGQRQY